MADINRRSFLKGSIAAVAVAGVGMAAGCGSASQTGTGASAASTASAASSASGSAASNEKVSLYGAYAGFSDEIAQDVVVMSQYVDVPAHYDSIYDGEKVYASDPDYEGSTIRLAVDIVLPADESGKAIDGKYPTIWQFSRGGRYVRDSRDSLLADYLVKHGYAYGIIELRGCGASEGVNNSFASLENRLDCKHVIEGWANGQAWCNGVHGSFGGSNKGLIQSAVATVAPKGLRAISPSVSSVDFYNQDYVNGVSACPVGMKLSGTSNDASAKSYDEWLSWDKRAVAVSDSEDDLRIAYDAYVYQTQKNLGFSTYMLLPNMTRDEPNPYMYDEPVNMTVPPCEHMQEFIDSGIVQYNYAGYSDSNVALELASVNTTGGYIVIGDGTHGDVSGPSLMDQDGTFDLQSVYQDRLRYFDWALKDIDNGLGSCPRYYYYVENAAEGTRWRYADAYPVMSNVVRTNFYLSKDDDTAFELPSALLLSGEQSNNGKLVQSVPADSRTTEYKVVDVSLPDGYSSYGPASKVDLSQALDAQAFTFTMQPVTAKTLLIGIATFDLWVSSDETQDADFISFLEAVNEDGYSDMLGVAQIRASHHTIDEDMTWDSTVGLAGRHHSSMTADVEAALAEGISQPTLLQFDFDVANYELQAGQTLRVSTVCMMTGMYQNEPYYLLDENGVEQYDESGAVIYKDAADMPTITIHTGGDYASFVTLPLGTDVENTHNGTVILADGASAPGTIYMFDNNWYMYSAGSWTKIPANSAYTVDGDGVANFADAGFKFAPEGAGPIANGIAQRYEGDAGGTYKFPQA